MRPAGTSRHAGLATEILLEDLAGLPVDVEYASEYTFRSRPPEASRILANPGVLVISQSGETADTLAALRHANARGLRTVAVTNHRGSTMAGEAGAALTTLAGIETAIPATKSFTTQLAVLHALALYLARRRGVMSLLDLQAHATALEGIPEQIERSGERADAADRIGDK